MGSFKLQYYLIKCVIIVIFSVALSSSNVVAAQRKLFIFGDSLFDAGNLQQLTPTREAGKWPYGMSMNNISTGRWSDGLLVPDYIGLFMKLQLIPAYLKPGSNFAEGANFAVAGAGALDDGSPDRSVQKQVGNFLKVAETLKQQVAEAQARRQISRSIFLFSIGGPDYLSAINRSPNATQSENNNLINMVLGNFTAAIVNVYNAGGRKFAFQSVGAMGCYPGSKQGHQLIGDQCYDKLNQVISQHNRAFLKLVVELHRHLPGFQFSVFDYYNIIRDHIHNPAKYGFKVGDKACCGSGANRGGACGSGAFEVCSDPSEYVYFDGGHTSQAANLLIARLLWNGGPQFTWPINMRQLFALPPFQSVLHPSVAPHHVDAA